MRRLSLLLLIFLIAGCQHSDDITYTGSNTVKKPVQVLVKAYTQKNPGIKIGIDGYGTNSFFISKKSIYGMSTEMKPVEKNWAKKYGPVERRVICYDALAIIVNRDNPVKKLDLNQLRQIYNGNINNWKEVGGKDAPITVMVRGARSGSEEFFTKKLLHGDKITARRYEFATYDKIMEAVSKHKYGICYVSVGYLNNKVKVIALAKDKSKPGALPNYSTLRNRTYFFTRPLYLLNLYDTDQKVKNFINFTLSTEGQGLLKNAGYLPVKE